MNKPIKRVLQLQSLSRDHHQGLLLSWKIRKGIKAGIQGHRIKRYVEWFFTNHLAPHFITEEKHLFPVLGNDHEMIAKALGEHRALESLNSTNDGDYEKLNRFADLLESHIRFEERELFNEIQSKATPEQLNVIDDIHHEELFCENSDDTFWL